MLPQEVIREMMKLKGTSQALVAQRAGFKYQSNLSEMLKSRNMRVDNFARILDALDCMLVVKSRTTVYDRDAGREYRPEYVIDMEPEANGSEEE